MRTAPCCSVLPFPRMASAFDSPAGSLAATMLLGCMLVSCGRVNYGYFEPQTDGGGLQDTGPAAADASLDGSMDAMEPDAPSARDGDTAPRDGDVIQRECVAGMRCMCPAGETCEFTCPDGGCEIECGERADCTLQCEPGDCEMFCHGGASCEIHCASQGCFRTCSVGNPGCEVHCFQNDCDWSSWSG